MNIMANDHNRQESTILEIETPVVLESVSLYIICTEKDNDECSLSKEFKLKETKKSNFKNIFLACHNCIDVQVKLKTTTLPTCKQMFVNHISMGKNMNI